LAGGHTQGLPPCLLPAPLPLLLLLLPPWLLLLLLAGL
jgi:hypothetical protein